MNELLTPSSFRGRTVVCQDIAPGAGAVFQETKFKDGDNNIMVADFGDGILSVTMGDEKIFAPTERDVRSKICVLGSTLIVHS